MRFVGPDLCIPRDDGTTEPSSASILYIVTVKQEESILILPSGIDNFVMELVNAFKQSGSDGVEG